jgi:hypothetical protein
MKYLDTLAEEIGKAPIGTVGSICAIISVVVDVVISQKTFGNLSSKGQFAIALLSSIMICFVFAFIPAKIFEN